MVVVIEVVGGLGMCMRGRFFWCGLMGGVGDLCELCVD